MSEWQPMGTAPKDGTEVLAFSNGQIGVVVWETWRQTYGPLANDGWEDVSEWFWSYGASMEPQPTHWMPLPAPPKASVPTQEEQP